MDTQTAQRTEMQQVVREAKVGDVVPLSALTEYVTGTDGMTAMVPIFTEPAETPQSEATRQDPTETRPIRFLRFTRTAKGWRREEDYSAAG
jgi:hypothetical protein